MTVHIESKKEDIAKIVLMPGDPKRSEYAAKTFLKDYRLVNTVRGMTAYTGYYKDRLVTIFPSGMGIPSMGIYSYELFKDYDVETIIRIGSCGGYVDKLNLKDLILVDQSYSESSYGVFLDNYKDKFVSSSKELNNIIESTAKDIGTKIFKGNIYCGEVFYEKNYVHKQRSKELDVLGIEMETFALFNNARKFNKKASALLTVSDMFDCTEKLTSEERRAGVNDMIVLALESCLKL